MKRDKRKRVSEWRMDLTECQVANCCKCGKESSDSIKNMKFFIVV